MEKIILLFGFDDLIGTQQAFALGEITKALQVCVARIDKSRYGRTMTALIREAAGSAAPGMTGASGKTPAGPDKPGLPARMLVFAGFSDQELYQVLDLCPACGISRGDLKAVLTAANGKWDAYRLCSNILEEHRKLGR